MATYKSEEYTHWCCLYSGLGRFITSDYSLAGVFSDLLHRYSIGFNICLSEYCTNTFYFQIQLLIRVT